MRIGRKPAARFQLAPEIFQLLRRNAPFEKRPRVHSRRRVALKINRVAFEIVGPRAKEMIESHFIQRGRRGVRRNVPADVVLHAVRAHHHGQRVPANQALDAPLEFLISREKRLEPQRYRVRVRRVRRKRQIDPGNRGVRAQPLQNFRSHFRSARIEHRVQRLQPLLNLRGI